MSTYSSIIVLASEIQQNPYGPFVYKKLDGTDLLFSNESDPFEFRLKAVSKLLAQNMTEHIVLVGGAIDADDAVYKPEILKYRLLTEHAVPERKMTVVKSERNTQGNALAVQQYLSGKDEEYKRHVGLLTSFFHLPRTIRTFVQEFGLNFIPVCAEGVVYEEEYDNIAKFYAGYGLTEIIGTGKGDKSQIKGFFDKEFGNYKALKK